MTLISSFGLALLMTLGFGLRLIVNDGLIKSLPALLYLIVNVFIFLNNLNTNFEKKDSYCRSNWVYWKMVR